MILGPSRTAPNGVKPARLAGGLGGDGAFALPAAIMVLFVVTVLSVALITVSVQSSSSASRDSNVKAELAASEAGIQVARYRLDQLQPTTKQCINESKAIEPKEKSKWEAECKDSAESLGNGATFQYEVSLPYEKSGEKCGGQTVAISSGKTERCITAEGKVNGVEPPVRLQSRVEASAGEALFPIKGVLGLHEVKVTGSVKVPGIVASNEKIIGEGSAAFDGGFELCPEKGSFKPGAGKERTSSGVTVGGKKETPELEKTRAASQCPIKASLPTSHATAESNEDSRIGKEDEFFTEGKSVNKFSGPPKYELNIGSNGKLTLGGSKYYLCNFKATNNSTLKIAAGAKVEIFIDSPEAEGSKCEAGTGKFEAGGSFKIENANKNPGALLIVMAGKGPFKFENGSGECGSSACFEASVYAPKAEVTINGGTKFKGGIVGETVHLENGAGLFEWSEETGALTNGTPTGYSRQVWEQCTRGATASEGC